MTLDRSLRDEQARGDLRVRGAVCDELRHLKLAPRQEMPVRGLEDRRRRYRARYLIREVNQLVAGQAKAKLVRALEAGRAECGPGRPLGSVMIGPERLEDREPPHGVGGTQEGRGSLRVSARDRDRREDIGSSR